MARPTKEQIAKREAIKELGLFVRDSDIYTYFEDETEKYKSTPTEISYYFCDECEKRDFTDNKGYWDDEKIDKLLSTEPWEKLLKLDEELEGYLHILHLYSTSPIPLMKFSSSTMVYKKDIEKALGINLNKYLAEQSYIRTKKFSPNGEPFNDVAFYEEFYNKHDSTFVNLKFLREEPFTEDDRAKIRNYYKSLAYCPNDLKHITLITKSGKEIIEPSVCMDKNTFAEIDLNKPLKELIEFVTLLKKNYDNNPQSISTFQNLIGMELEDHKCSTQTCEIYKHKNPKPLSGRLMDVLFIYDCKKAGLSNKYIMEKIDNYWSVTKDLRYEPITLNTLQKYNKLAKDYIDKKEYKNFIKGYEIPLE